MLSMQHRHALVRNKMTILTVTRKVLKNDRHSTCTRTHPVESENSRFFCFLLPLCFSSVSGGG